MILFGDVASGRRCVQCPRSTIFSMREGERERERESLHVQMNPWRDGRANNEDNQSAVGSEKSWRGQDGRAEEICWMTYDDASASSFRRRVTPPKEPIVDLIRPSTCFTRLSMHLPSSRTAITF